MKKSLFGLLIAVTLFACKKDDNSSSNNNGTTATIVAKWTYSQKISWYPIMGAMQKDTINFPSNTPAYEDFRNDGKVYGYYQNGLSYVYDTLNYSYNSTTNKVTFSATQRFADTMQVNTLTTTSLQLYSNKNGIQNWVTFKK